MKLIHMLVIPVAVTSCASSCPQDLKLNSVTETTYRQHGELPAPPMERGGPLRDSYFDYLLQVAERKRNLLQPEDVQPYFDNYALDREAQVERPDKPLLMVEFSSKQNLAELVSRRSHVIGIHGYYCEQPDYPVLMSASGLYSQRLRLTPIFQYDISPAEEGYKYYTFLYVQQESGAPSSYHGFDLRTAQEPVCLQLRIGAMGVGCKSNIITIPVAAIAAALNMRR